MPGVMLLSFQRMKVPSKFIIFFITASLCMAGCSPHYGLTSQELEGRIAGELPEGSDASKIFSFLDKNRIDHSPLIDMNAEFPGNARIDSFLNDPKLEGKRGRVRKQIAAKVPDVKYGFLNSFDIFVRFYLDDENKLVGFVAKTIGTGP
jgi:hypothetical protein